MAFNPFHTFRKYQKYWMAGAVLVCMLTFVMCSGGIRGTGLDDLFMKYLGRRHGEFLVKVNGTRYYNEDLSKLKTQRNMANEYMRELFKVGIDRLEIIIKQMQTGDSVVKDDQKREELLLLKKSVEDLMGKLAREPRFFHGGTKLDDLVDFICWRDLADKYSVNIDDTMARALVNSCCHANLWGFDDRASNEVQAKVQASHHEAGDIMAIRNAIKQEFRVQIIQLALMARWSPGPEKIMINAEGEKRPVSERDEYAFKRLPDGMIQVMLNTPLQMRIVPTPEQFSADYRKKRTELTIDLLPVSLEVMAKQVTLPADEKVRLEKLKKFYDEYKTKLYNPNLDTPGFKLPVRVEVQFLTANADMEYYKEPAKLASVLEKTPATAFNPLSPMAGALTFSATPSLMDAWLQKKYLDVERATYMRKWYQYYNTLVFGMERIKQETDTKAKADIQSQYDQILKSVPIFKHGASSLTNPKYYSPGQYNLALEKPNGETAAALVGGLNAGSFCALAEYQSEAFRSQAKKVAPLAKLDKAHRIEAGVELVLARTPQFFGGAAFTAAGLTYNADLEPQFLPVGGYLEKELQNKSEAQRAQLRVNKTMIDVRDQLEKFKGNEAGFEALVKQLRQEYSREVVDKKGAKRSVPGLQFGETPHLLSEYEIEFDQTLEPLRKEFEKDYFLVNSIESRTGKEKLQEGDFYKLFFGTERLGVGPLPPFKPKTWRPTVTSSKYVQKNLAARSLDHNLFDDTEKPFIFWKSVARGEEPMEWRPSDPKMLAFVEKQYREQEARAKLFEEVKKITAKIKDIQGAGTRDVAAAMQQLAKEHGTHVLTLNNVAMMVPNSDNKFPDRPAYVDYALPRERIPYARADMAKQLLSLGNLSAPLKTEVEESDKVSKAPGAEAALKRAKAELEALDTLNQGLFRLELANSAKIKGGQVQVLTNKPRNVYYIALVAAVKEPSMTEALAQALSKDNSQHAFVDQVQQALGKELLQMMSTLWRDTPGMIEITEEARKQFGDEGPGR